PPRSDALSCKTKLKMSPCTPISIERRGPVNQALRGLGSSELLTAHLLGAGVAFAPTIDDKVVLGDEIAHSLRRFEVIASLYELSGYGDLQQAVSRQLKDLPSPRSWSE